MSETLEKKLAGISARFAGQVGQYRAELAEACQRQDFEVIIDKAHKLAGIAPMFGHIEIGEAALALEEAAEARKCYIAEASHLDALLAAFGP